MIFFQNKLNFQWHFGFKDATKVGLLQPIWFTHHSLQVQYSLITGLENTKKNNQGSVTFRLQGYATTGLLLPVWFSRVSVSQITHYNCNDCGSNSSSIRFTKWINKTISIPPSTIRRRRGIARWWRWARTGRSGCPTPSRDRRTGRERTTCYCCCYYCCIVIFINWSHDSQYLHPGLFSR